MDDTIRQMRARHWQTITNETSREPDTTAKNDGQADRPEKKTLNFGHVGSLPVEISATTSTTIDEDDADETYMMNQLGRRPSAPYSFVPPATSRVKPDQTTSSGVKMEREDVDTTTPPPGSWPADVEEPAEETVKEERKEEKKDEKVKPEDPATDSEERTCRICFSPATEEERLISPCKCRGTSKWIHLTCLNTWRTHSQNSKSFYRCDQCHYEYSFRRTDLANLLMSQYTLLVLTGLTFFLSAFLGGFVIKLGLFLMPPEYLTGSTSWFTNFSFFYTPLDAGTDMLQAASNFVPSTPQTWRDIFVIDSWHFVQGIISLGLWGLVTLAGTGGIFSLRTLGPRNRRARGAGGRGNDGSGVGLSEVLFLLVILLGCGKVIWGMFGRVKGFVKRRLDAGAERILEVDP